MAYRAMDNVGVQYGLVAFNKGEISADQFVDLNERIGGFDQYGHISDERGQAPDAAIHNAYAYGRSNNVKSLGEIPIIDFRTYLEHLPDVHDSIRSFSMRERLKAANGSADNQVIIVHHRNHPGGWGVVDAQVLDWMDQWVTAIQADMAPGSEAERVVRNKPAGLSDGCYTEQGGWVAAEQGYMQSQCAEMYTPHGDPRIAAGAPVANNVLKCALKPLHKGDYEQTLTDDQFARLQQVFPSGVCDYSATSNLQAEGVADWQTWRVY